MKRFFTFLAGALLAGGLTTQADTVSFGVYDWVTYAKAAANFTSEMTYSKGVYTIENYLQTGTPLQFKFTPAAEGEIAEMIFEGDGLTNNLEVDTYGFYLMDADDNYPEGYLDALSGDPMDDIVVYYPFTYTGAEYSFVETLGSSSAYDYWGCIMFTGDDSDDDDAGYLPYYYLSFYFNAQGEDEPQEPEEPSYPEPEGYYSTVDVLVEAYNAGTECSYDAALVMNADGTYSVSNFINSGFPLTFSFDPIAVVDETTAITLHNTLEAGSGTQYFMSPSGKYPRCYFIEEDGTKTMIRYPYIWTSESYSYVWRCDKEEYGYDYYIELCCSGWLEDGVTSADYYYVSFYFNALETPGVTDFSDVVMGSLPATDEPIDLDEYELGAGFLNIVLGGDIMLNPASGKNVTISSNGETVASIRLKEENVIPYGGAEPYAEDGEIDPGMTGSGMTVVELDFGMAITDPGEYTVTFPEGLLMYATGSMLSAGELTYTVKEREIVESGISFSELLAYSEPLPGEAIDLESNAMGAGYITMLLGADVSLYPYFSAPVTMSLNGEVVASVTLTEEDVMPYEPIDPFKAPARIMKADEMGLNYTIVVVDFDKYLTEPGTYTLTVPANILQFADGTTVGEGQLEFIVQDEANAKSVNDILAASFPEVNQDVNLDEYPEGLGNIKLLFFGNLEVAMGVMESVQLLRDEELVATVEPVDLIVSPFGDASNEMTQVIFNTGMEITEPGNYELRFPKGTFKFENGEKTLAGSFHYTIAEPMAIVAYDITPRPYDEGLGNEVNSLSRFTVSVSDLDYTALAVSDDAQVDLLFADGKRMPLTATQESATSVTFTLPYTVYVPGTYALAIPEGSLVATQNNGKEATLQNIDEDYVICQGEPVAILDLLSMAEPNFTEQLNIDLEGNEAGLQWVNLAFSTTLNTVDGAEGSITLSKDGGVVATAQIEVIPPYVLEDATDTMEMVESILVMAFGDEAINEVGTYTLSIPDGMFWANNSPTLGGELTYVVVNNYIVGVNGVFGNATEFNVVDLNGRVLLRNASAEQVNALGAGLYIINGVKVIKK